MPKIDIVAARPGWNAPACPVRAGLGRVSLSGHSLETSSVSARSRQGEADREVRRSEDADRNGVDRPTQPILRRTDDRILEPVAPRRGEPPAGEPEQGERDEGGGGSRRGGAFRGHADWLNRASTIAAEKEEATPNRASILSGEMMLQQRCRRQPAINVSSAKCRLVCDLLYDSSNGVGATIRTSSSRARDTGPAGTLPTQIRKRGRAFQHGSRRPRAGAWAAPPCSEPVH